MVQQHCTVVRYAVTSVQLLLKQEKKAAATVWHDLVASAGGLAAGAIRIGTIAAAWLACLGAYLPDSGAAPGERSPGFAVADTLAGMVR